MKLLKIEVNSYQNGKFQYRVTALNSEGAVQIGLSRPFEKSEGDTVLQDLVTELGKTQGHVPHISSLGHE